MLKINLVWFLGLHLITCPAKADYGWDDVTLLDEYVTNDDGAYTYTYKDTYNYTGITLHIYNMTSQYYLTENHTNHHLWWHVVGCAFPHDNQFPDAGFVFLIGGNNRDDSIPPPNDLWNLGIVKMANDTKLAGCYIGQVINGPITYYNDEEGRGLTGDSQIAYTWRSFIDDPDWSGPTILSRFPMTKASYHGVDTLINVARDQESMDITRIIAAGGSKWGWTTWSLAAVDRRLTAITPIVFSLFNIQQTMMHHYQALDGAWSFAMEPYYNEGLTRDLTNENAEDMMQYEDMYYYRRRYDGLPKLMISATGDEYFFPQDFHTWWEEWPEPKWLMMVPNAEHILFPHYPKLFGSLTSFWISVLRGDDIPHVTWSRDHHADWGEIRMDCSEAPLEARAMRAVTLQNDTRRDFRLIAGYPPSLHPVFWFPSPMMPPTQNGTSFRHRVDEVEGEWVGHMIEATFPGPEEFEDNQMIFTTEVNIVPDDFPAEPCETPEDCYGYLV